MYLPYLNAAPWFEKKDVQPLGGWRVYEEWFQYRTAALHLRTTHGVIGPNSLLHARVQAQVFQQVLLQLQ